MTERGDDWTTLELKTLKELKAKGWSNASIARRLGRTQSAVAYRWSTMSEYISRDYKRTATEQLCCYCIHAVPDPRKGIGCNWSRHFLPVEGWTAVPTIVKHNPDKHMRSFHVKKCPQFKEG